MVETFNALKCLYMAMLVCVHIQYGVVLMTDTVPPVLS